MGSRAVRAILRSSAAAFLLRGGGGEGGLIGNSPRNGLLQRQRLGRAALPCLRPLRPAAPGCRKHDHRSHAGTGGKPRKPHTVQHSSPGLTEAEVIASLTNLILLRTGAAVSVLGRGCKLLRSSTNMSKSNPYKVRDQPFDSTDSGHLQAAAPPGPNRDEGLGRAHREVGQE